MINLEDFSTRSKMRRSFTVFRVYISIAKSIAGNPLMDVVLDAEALSMPGTPARDSVFPRFKLPTEVTETDTTLEVSAETIPIGFPKQAPFVVRIGKELIEVKEISDAGWKLERGVQGTTAASHPLNDQLEMLRFRSEATENQRRANGADRVAQFLRQTRRANRIRSPTRSDWRQSCDSRRNSFVSGLFERLSTRDTTSLYRVRRR